MALRRAAAAAASFRFTRQQQCAARLRAVTLVVEQREMSGNQEQLDYLPLARVAIDAKRQGQGSFFDRQFSASSEAWRLRLLVRARDRQRAATRCRTTRDSVHWTREKGSMGPAVVEPACPRAPKRIRRYRQTIHLRQLRVPDWAADVVYYYVFPERFRNGDRATTRSPGATATRPTPSKRTPRWLERPHRPGSGERRRGATTTTSSAATWPASSTSSTTSSDARRQHDLHDAGVPRRQQPQVRHRRLQAIDPAFGTQCRLQTPDRGGRQARHARDPRHLAEPCRLGLALLRPLRQLRRPRQGAFANGKPNPASPYFSWFLFDPTKTDPNDQYQGWVGVKDLPELNKDSPAWRHFAFRDPDSVTRHWLGQGASGWRMDVAPWVNDSFWREWSQRRSRKRNPTP
jgi:cyclomaltodextrinase